MRCSVTRSTLLLAILIVTQATTLSAANETAVISDFKQAITETALTNPGVKASWYAFEAAREEQRVARGGYYPKLDLVSDIGHERVDDPLTRGDDYSRSATRLTLTQMLFDGFATRDEVARLGYSKLARYYDFKLASEEASLEAAVAYLDVLTYQRLVSLAEDNYVQHRQIYDQISERAEGGVSRGVDLEQANARLALAETNLLTEMTNLHDVQARFQRITGFMPAAQLAQPSMPVGLIPQSREGALNAAYQRSPEINAAIENLRSAQSALNAKNAPMYPRLDLRFREELEHDTDGISGQYDESAVELVLTYNLYNGGSDRARKREYYQRLNQAVELRELACRNVRQNVMIAYNDISSLREQLIYLDRNQLSIGKARVAYRNQFAIGQRTLLDLLDNENEYFETRRALVIAEERLLNAQATTLSGMGLLLAAMNVDGLSNEASAALDLSRDDQSLCREEAPTLVKIDKDALFAKLMGNSSRYRKVADNKVALEVEVRFAHNSSQITSAFDIEIENAAAFLASNPEVMVMVEGHTDASGSDDYNQWLSTQRAEAVKQMIITQHGLAPARIEAQGFGESQPIADNETELGRSQNRRVELIFEQPAAAEGAADSSSSL